MTFWEITRKDLILLIRDPRALAVLVAFPLLFIVIIGLTTGQLLGWKAKNQTLKLGFVDRIDYRQIDDETERKRLRNIVVKAVNRIQNRRGFQIEELSDETYRGKVDDETLDAVVVVGSEFPEKLNSLQVEDVLSDRQGKLDGALSGLDMSLYTRLDDDSSTRSLIEQTVYGDALQTIVPHVFCEKLRFNRLTVNARVSQRCAGIREELDGPPLTLAPPAVAKSSGENAVYQELIPSYTVMFVFFLVNVMARSFLHESDLGTMRRLRLAPISSASLVAGKTLPFFIISLVQSILLFLCGKLFFGMSWGNSPIMLLPVIVSTSLAATGLGLVVATLVRSESQVSAYANIVVITMAGISGCFMPRDWLPANLRTISLGTPHAWSLMSYEQLLKHNVADLAVVWQNCGMLVLFAVLYFAFGCARFRRVV